MELVHIFITKRSGGNELIEEGRKSGLTLAFPLSPLRIPEHPAVIIFLLRENNDSLKGQKAQLIPNEADSDWWRERRSKCNFISGFWKLFTNEVNRHCRNTVEYAMECRQTDD